jgi:small subunit ribosomal protein S7e
MPALFRQAIFDLQVQSDMKAELQDLFITSAKEVEVSSNRKAIIIHVPFRLLKNFHRIQQRLIRELEKKFSGKHVTIVAHRRILPREGRKNRTNKQMRPFSRTLTSVRNHFYFNL